LEIMILSLIGKMMEKKFVHSAQRMVDELDQELKIQNITLSLQ